MASVTITDRKPLISCMHKNISIVSATTDKPRIHLQSSLSPKMDLYLKAGLLAWRPPTHILFSTHVDDGPMSLRCFRPRYSNRVLLWSLTTFPFHRHFSVTTPQSIFTDTSVCQIYLITSFIVLLGKMLIVFPDFYKFMLSRTKPFYF